MFSVLFDEKKMKKTLLAIIITSSLSTSVLAQTQTTETNLADSDITETFVVTANRTTQEKFDVLAAVDVFDRAEIERLQPSSVAELLNQVAGISTSSLGSQAHQTSVFVRGANSDHVLVLINGVRVGDATFSTKDVSSIPVQQIERVEVVRGPRAALWGSDAIGGVIQIFTRKLSNGEGQVGAKLGNNKYWQGYGAIGFGTDKHSYTITGSAESSDGYDILVDDPSNPYPVGQDDDDGYNRESIGLNGTSEFNDLYSLEINSQFDKGLTELDSAYTGDETEYQNYHVLVRNHFNFEESHYQLGFSRAVDDNEDNYGVLNSWAVNNTFKTQRDQISATGQVALGKESEIAFGGEWYQEQVKSSQAFSQDERTAKALFVTGRHTISDLKLEGSLRGDKIGNIDTEVTYQLGSGYQLSEQLLIALTYGTAFKAPSFNDLYWKDPYYEGNPDLAPETAENLELLTRYQASDYSVELSLYKTEYDNLIENGAKDANNPWGVWTAFNVAKATVKGAEATINANILSSSNRLTLSHLDAEDDSTGQQLLRRPYFTAYYSISYKGDNWDANFNVDYQGSRYDNLNFVRTKIGGYTLFGLAANYNINEQLTLLAKITNLTDKAYQPVPEYPGEERGFNIGFDYKF